MLETIFKIALFIHVIAGASALLSGLVAMSIGKKGGKVHNLSGIIYYWSMATIFITSVLFFLIKPSVLKYQFFLGIAVVSFYPCFTGKRMLGMKKGLNLKAVDKLSLFLIGIAGGIMITYGVFCLNRGGENFQIGILFLIFGTVGLGNFGSDFKNFILKKPSEKMFWFFSHGGKMLGSYGAALTAFCVNIVPRYLPDGTPTFVFIMTWTMPSILMSLLTFYLIKKYRKIFSNKIAA